jgi:hypothetical protein
MSLVLNGVNIPVVLMIAACSVSEFVLWFAAAFVSIDGASGILLAMTKTLRIS